jgi:hypothetical protein
MFLAVLKNNQLNEHLTIFIQQPVARGASVISQFTMVIDCCIPVELIRALQTYQISLQLLTHGTALYSVSHLKYI